MKDRLSYILIMLVMLVTCGSCREELCYDHYPVYDLRFSWELEWERDYGMGHSANWDASVHHYEYDQLRPSEPEWVKMIRYFSDGRISERFFNTEGLRFQVDADEDCSLLCYNGDTEFIILSEDTSMHDVCATATGRSRSGATLLQEMQELHKPSRTTNPPDVIYASYVDHVSGIKNHEVKDLPMNMQPLVFTYLITYEFEHGIEYVALARGALGGMAEGVYLRTGVTTEQTSIILFDCDIHDGACQSQVRSFGIPGFPDSYYGRIGKSTPGPFSLNLELKLINGKTVEYNFDITDQLKTQPRGGVIHIKGLRIEDDIISQPSSGFEVSVDGWDDEKSEIIDLPIGPLNNQ